MQEIVQVLSTAPWNGMVYRLFLMKKNYLTKWGSKASTLIILCTKLTTKQSRNLYKFCPWNGMLLACYIAYFLGTKTM